MSVRMTDLRWGLAQSDTAAPGEFRQEVLPARTARAHDDSLASSFRRRTSTQRAAGAC